MVDSDDFRAKQPELLDNDMKCGRCGKSAPHRTIHEIPQPNSWWKVYNWWREHGMGKGCESDSETTEAGKAKAKPRSKARSSS